MIGSTDRTLILQADKDVTRGEVVPFGGSGHFVALNDAAAGEPFYVFMRMGNEPLPNPGRPHSPSLLHRLWVALLIRYDVLCDKWMEVRTR